MTALLHADIKMPAIFGDHMVLQQDSKLPIWGWASPGERITVAFGKQTASTTTPENGQWRLELSKEASDGGPRTLTVTGKNTLTFQDVVVGDVWIASGQSNMEFGIQSEQHGRQAIAEAKDSQIRMFFVPWATSLTPMPDLGPATGSPLDGKWQVCSPEIMGKRWAWNGFSALGYYFAREIRKQTANPIGMIATCKGGTSAQAWTSLSALEKEPALVRHVSAYQKIATAFPQAQRDFATKQAEFQTALKQWNEAVGLPLQQAEANWRLAVEKSKADGSTPPPRPRPATPSPTAPAKPDGGYSTPGNLFNAMVAPLIPYAIKGVIWYQGEGNGDNLVDAKEYTALFPLMIKDWRDHWGAGDFPFLFVQLANIKAPARAPVEGNWAWVRDAQLKALALPNTGMASAVDLGDPNNVHPASKLELAQRLALVARHVAHGQSLVYSGPLYDRMVLDGDKIRIKFKHIGGGLVISKAPWTPDGVPPALHSELEGFGIAGADRKFVWAKARIESDHVVVSSEKIRSPVAVRYGWANNPTGNLYNKEGLPASPFRTDNWDAITQ